MSTNAAVETPAPVLSSAAWRLEPFTEAHISDRYLAWLNDPGVTQFLEVRWTPQTFKTARAFVRSFYGTTEKYLWGIYPHDQQEPVGTATLYEVDRHHGSAELGLLIGERVSWGRRTAIEVIELIAQFAFEAAGLRRLTGGTYAVHHGMNFIYKRLGFRCEGILRQAYCLTPGQYVDGYRWALLADEWSARHDA